MHVIPQNLFGDVPNSNPGIRGGDAQSAGLRERAITL